MMETTVNLRAAVTRDERPDGDLARALKEAGLEPVRCPAVVTLPAPDPDALTRAARALERFDWLIVSSARAVAILMEARAGVALPPSLRSAAVGARTAAALEAAGARGVWVAFRPGARELARDRKSVV